MYNQFFGLQKNPFNMTPDPAFLFLTAQHREALAGLVYALLQKKGFLVLTGDAGTGKTTLVSKTLQCVAGSSLRTSLVLNPTLTTAEFLEMVMLDFGIADVPASKAQRLVKLHAFLLDGLKSGSTTALIIDEAHKLSPEVLEEIRLLGNFESADQKLLQILLIGQSELDDILNRPDLRQFKQRIALRLSLQPLSPAEIDEYIRYRWVKAGGAGMLPLTVDAVGVIATVSKGIPRVINAVCDNALMLAFGEGLTSVTPAHVQAVARDLNLVEKVTAAEPPVPVVPAAAPVAPVKAAAPAPAPPAAMPLTMRSLGRYEPERKRASLLKRWAGRLGLAQGMGIQ